MAKLNRRLNVELFLQYQQYKSYLREDFLYQCVYCTIHENEFGGHRHFHVEHYRPKKFFPELIIQYNNLLYACGVCNSFKREDWPSDKPLEDGKGYIDPCEHDYENHFRILADYQVEGLTAVAKYMVERLHLNRRQLQKLRERRAREADIYRRSLQLCEAALSKLEEALAEPALKPVVRNALLMAQQIIRSNCEEIIKINTERWIPAYDWEDYR